MVKTMNAFSKLVASCFVTGMFVTSQQAISAEKQIPVPPPAPNGIEFPVNYQDWDIISVSNRTDNGTIRSIIGNDIAVKAVEEGKTNPWPDGAAIGKLVWKKKPDAHWKGAEVPGKFVHAEFMFKDAEKWKDTKGWGWARWLGTEQKPFGKNAVDASASCIACHTPVKSNDWMFTHPAVLPKRVYAK